MLTKTFQTTEAGYTMTADVAFVGIDLLIVLTGGDAPHLGTVTAVADDMAPETIRFHSHHGRYHKDDVLSTVIADIIKEALPGHCLITAGIHVNGISDEQINASAHMAQEIGQQVLAWLQTSDITAPDVVYTRFHQTFDA
ncbi:amino acid decarboxylase [Enterococcus sp. DIV0876]|uniref:prenylated flavin chaperone LpdD n=1 Tax=Enterococcus sp. DIV0876 TaxID=2774633 RepID=UPI003D300C26